jgi:hypothetical protein
MSKIKNLNPERKVTRRLARSTYLLNISYKKKATFVFMYVRARIDYELVDLFPEIVCGKKHKLALARARIGLKQRKYHFQTKRLGTGMSVV